MAKNLRRQKIHLLPCAFLVSRHGIFKIHLSQSVFLVFWRCIFFAYVWCICDAIFAKKCIFFYAFGTCVSPRRIFFPPWAPASCAGVFILRVCGNRTCTFTASVFSYPHIVHFFWKVNFGLHLWKQKSHFCCKCILAAHVFLRSSVLLIVLR